MRILIWGMNLVLAADLTEEGLLSMMDSNKIDAAICLPLPRPPDLVAAHDAIAAAQARNSGRIFGVASVNPVYFKELAPKEIRRCIEDLKFVGVKMHCDDWSFGPLMAPGEYLAKIAEDIGVPLIIHCGIHQLHANTPRFVGTLAKAHPGLTAVIAHFGGATGASAYDAMLTAEENPNVFVETSFSSIYYLMMAVDKLGADKLMFGSDLPLNAPVELAKIRALSLKPSDERKILAETASKVFRISQN